MIAPQRENVREESVDSKELRPRSKEEYGAVALPFMAGWAHELGKDRHS